MATILVVDDQPVNRELLVTLLGYKGHHLVEAANGVEALELAGAKPLDLIIADILMPTMDGYEFVHRLRAEPTLSQIPIIFYTAHYRGQEALALAQACGVNYVLTKPSPPEAILQTVEVVLNLPLPEALPPLPEVFDREHVRLLTDKLSQKVEELQGVNDRLNKLYAELQRQVEKLEREGVERKQAEEALRASEERFRQVVVSISDHVYMTEVTAVGVYKNRYLSPNVEKLTGYSLEKFEADWNFWRCLIHLDDQAAAAAQVETLRQGRNSEVEYRLNRADGAVIWVRDSARVESSGGAQIIYGVVGNITLRKQADEQIRHLASLVENVSEAIISTNLDFQIVSWNKAAEAIYGWTEAEVSGHSVNAFLQTRFHAVTREEVISRFMKIGSWKGEVQQCHKNGAILEILTSTALIKDSLGQPVGIVAVNHDITERRQMEERLRQKRELLRHLGARLEHVIEAEKRQLSRELHDRVGQSTTTLALNLTILQSLLPVEALEAREWLKQSLTEVKTITSAIRGVMQELRPPELDDYGLTAALQWYAQQFEQRSGIPITIEAVELTPRLPLETETALFRITQEALTNVLKHAQASHITISLERLAQGVRLVIADNGLGFVPQELEVFKPSVKERGWGLLTMRERAFAIGGDLTATSAPGQGARIIVNVKG